MKFKELVAILTLLVCINPLRAQYSWDWHDPLDLNHLDLGDNKLLLYNAIGVGLSLKLTSLSPIEKKEYKDYNFSSFVDVLYEYSRPPKSDVFIGRFRVDKKVRKHLSIGGDLGFYKVSDIEVSTYGVGVQAVFIWQLMDKPNWRLHFDNGVGPNYFVQPYPFGGTHFNFTTYYGLYASIRMPSIAWLVIGVKNVHISNADIKGRERNPALDGLGLSVGYSFF